MSNLAKDNFYPNCPAVMGYSAMTDFRPSQRREQYVKTINGIVDNDDYRLFLQANATKIMNGEWEYLKTNHSCFPNECIHQLPSRPTPGSMSAEMKLYNDVRSKKVAGPKCETNNDYRMTM